MKILTLTLRVAIGSAVLGTAIVAASCGSTSTSTATPTSPSPMPTPTGGTPPNSTQVVTIQQNASTLGGNAFGANPFTISAGTAVTWSNTDNVAHTSTSNSGVWNSGVIPARGQFTFTFATAGTFPYHCTIHPGMTGLIIVQ